MDHRFFARRAVPIAVLCVALVALSAVAWGMKIACPSCGSAVEIRAGADKTKCGKCGHVIDAKKYLREKAALLAKFEKVSPEKAKSEGCLSCHQGIATIGPKMSFIRSIGGRGKGCVICHEGNAEATTREAAHKGMFPDPGNMWVVSQYKGCGKCHSRKATVLPVTSFASDPIGEANHVYRVERNLMSTTMGILNNALCANGLLPIGVRKYANVTLDDPLGPTPVCGTPTYKKWVAAAIKAKRVDYMAHVEKLMSYADAVKKWGEPKAMIVDYYRKECARCHVWTEGADARGDRRAGGCSACHVLYSNDAYYEGGDPTICRDEIGRPLRHEIVLRPPSVQCTRCHTRGKRIGTSFVGIMEFPYLSPWRKDGSPQWKLHKKRYLHIGADLHYRKGIECADCHTSRDVHGDGNIYPTTTHEVEIECQDCHGTPEKYPWELPIGYSDSLQLGDKPRGVFRMGGKEYTLTARGNPFGNVIKNGDALTLTDSHGKKHRIPLLKKKAETKDWEGKDAAVAMVTVPHTKKLECYACHAVWAPQCYGCHLREDFSGRTTGGKKTQHDWLASTHAHDSVGRTGQVSTPGKITETRSYLRWERPPLAMNTEGRVSPVMPGCQVIATFIDKDGRVVTLNEPFQSSLKIAGLAINPAQPHTMSHHARSCENCHADPKALGYGIDGGRFAVLSKAHQGDLPGVKRTETQIPAIDFPHDLSTLVTPEGRQVQTMTYPTARPLNDKERSLADREGLCVACHQLQGSPEWAELKKRFGAASDPDAHARMMEAAVKALMKKK